MWLAGGVREGLVDEAHDDRARVRPDQSLHLAGLTDRLDRLRTPELTEERQVGLRHDAQLIAPLVDRPLHRPLREAQEAHVGYLREQDVVGELGAVAADDTLLQMPHRVRAAQPDLAPVEREAPLRGGRFVLLEDADAKLAFGGVHHGLAVEQPELELVEPGRIEVPQPGLADADGDAVGVRAAADRLRHRRVAKLVQVAVPANLRRYRLVTQSADGRRLEVASEDGDLEGDGGGLGFSAHHVHADLRVSLEVERQHREVADEPARARLEAYRLVDPHRGRAVVPPLFRVVVAGTGRRVDLLAVAERRRVVFHLHEKRVFTDSRVRGDFALERREEALVRAGVRAVEEDVRAVVDAVEADPEAPRLRHRARRAQRGPVVRHHRSERRAVVGNPHAFPLAAAGERMPPEVAAVVVGLHAPVEVAQRRHVTRHVELRSEVPQVRPHASASPVELAVELRGGVQPGAGPKGRGTRALVEREYLVGDGGRLLLDQPVRALLEPLGGDAREDVLVLRRFVHEAGSIKKRPPRMRGRP